VLDLSFNVLASLPEDIGVQLPALQQLYLCNNILVSLPKSLASCPIAELLASENGFKEVPRVVFALPQLAKLSLGACRLTDLPENISCLKNLRCG
jgi:internalin A